MSKNEVSYLVTMLLLRKMMDESLLSQDDYKAINDRMKQKYDLKIGNLFTSVQVGDDSVTAHQIPFKDKFPHNELYNLMTTRLEEVT